jgi:AraC family transcriptional activator of pobA
MDAPEQIPVFSLFGEERGFPDVVHCERIVDRARGHGWIITPHRHSALIQVFWIESGAAEARVDGSIRALGRNAFLFVPVGAVHGFDFTRDTEGMVMSIPVTTLGQSHAAGAYPELEHAFSGDAPAPLAQLLRSLAECYASAAPYRAHLLAALAQAVMAMLAGMAPAQAAHPTRAPKIAELDALLARNPASGWRPRDYAAALRITTGQLTRICKAARGKSASAYIEAALMTEACRMLAFTRMPVAEVGYRLGYGDPSHFSRRFAATAGERPSAYRARFTG